MFLGARRHKEEITNKQLSGLFSGCSWEGLPAAQSFTTAVKTAAVWLHSAFADLCAQICLTVQQLFVLKVLLQSCLAAPLA